MLEHKKRTPSIWNKRFVERRSVRCVTINIEYFSSKLLHTAGKRHRWDGLSSARYNLTSAIAYPLFTHLLIDVGLPPPGFS
jgi:hypothetical protein